MTSVADSWQILGQVFAIDGETPFRQGTVKIVDSYNGTEYRLGESGLDSTGHYGVTFSSSLFQRGDSTRLNPTAVIRVYDYQGRVLFQSDVSVISSVNYVSNIVVVSMPVPDTWHVYAQAFASDGKTSFTRGKLVANCLISGTECYLGENSLDGTGHATITFSRSQFQQGDASRTTPCVVFRIYDESSNLVWQSNSFSLPDSEYTLAPVVIGSTPESNVPAVPDNWTIQGYVKNADGSPISGAVVKAFDETDGVETALGQTASGTDGSYQITFVKAAFQNPHPTAIEPEVCVKIFDANGLLLAQSAIQRQASTPLALNLVIASVDWIVAGTIRDSNGALVTLGTVCAFDVQGPIRVLLGSVSLNSAGQYSIPFKSSAFQCGNTQRTAPDLQVALENPAGNVLIRSATIQGAAPSTALNLMVSVSSANAVLPAYCVYGKITNKAGLAAAHYPVSAYSLSFNGAFVDTLLGQTVTAQNGSYVISYDPSLLSNPIPATPSDAKGDDTFYIKLPQPESVDNKIYYFTSLSICPVARQQKIDMQITGASGSDESEYDTVAAALSSYKNSMESLTVRDEPAFTNYLTFAANAAGVAESKTRCYYFALHSKADILAITAAIVPDFTIDDSDDFYKFMYAMFRLGKGTSIEELAKIAAVDVFDGISASIKSRIIPESATPNLSVFWEQWQKIVQLLAASTVLDNPTIASPGLFAATVAYAKTGTGLNEVTMLSGSAANEVQIVTKLWHESEDNMKTFWSLLWKDVKASGTDTTKELDSVFVQQLAFLYDLYGISKGFPAFAQGCLLYFVTVKESKYATPAAAYDIKNLAGMTRDEWTTMTKFFLQYTNDVYPKTLTGANDAEKLAILVQQTMAAYRSKYPVANVIAGFSATATLSPSESKLTLADLSVASAFLAGANDFDLATTNVASYLKAHDLDGNAALSTQLRAVQRLYRLTRDPIAIRYLIGLGLDSAYKIALLNEDQFIADHLLGLGGINKARQIHRLATLYASNTVDLVSRYNDNLNIGTTVLPSSAAATTKAVSDQNPSPTIETLFGSQTQAMYKNSQSVFSPAAYFVDLLQFIEGLNRSTLMTRRPDLAEIDLTGANSNTTLPYIDLVLEQLENAVAPLLFYVPDPNNGDGTTGFSGLLKNNQVPVAIAAALSAREIELSPSCSIAAGVSGTQWYLLTGSWRILVTIRPSGALNGSGTDDGKSCGAMISCFPQTSRSSDDLAVVPEHRNAAAYTTLSDLCFPLQLPLDPGAVEVRTSLALLGTSPMAVAIALETPSESDPYADKAPSNLGLSDTEVKIFGSDTNSSFVNPWELWGLIKKNNSLTQPGSTQITLTGDWTAIMSNVPVFMQKTGLNVDEMLDLVGMQILNADGHITLVPLPESKEDAVRTGDPDKFYLSSSKAWETDLVLIHRLLRLRSITGWNFQNLDSFLCTIYPTLEPSYIDLRYIHAAKAIQARFNLSAPEIACWWNDFSLQSGSRSGKSYFEQVFLAKRFDDATIGLFKGILDRSVTQLASDINASDENTSTVRQALLRVLGIPVSDLNRIVANESLKAVDLSCISTLYRVVSVANAVHLSIAEYYFMRNVFGFAAFGTPTMPLVMDDAVKRMSARGISVAQMASLLLDSSAQSDDSDWVVSLMQNLRDLASKAFDYLSSDAVPAYADYGDLTKYRSDYWSQQVSANLDLTVNGAYGELLGNDTAFAANILGKYPSSQSSVAREWKKMAGAGWTITINSNQPLTSLGQWKDLAQLSASASTGASPLSGTDAVSFAAWILPDSSVVKKLKLRCTPGLTAKVLVNGTQQDASTTEWSLSLSQWIPVRIEVVLSGFSADGSKPSCELVWMDQTPDSGDAGFTTIPGTYLLSADTFSVSSQSETTSAVTGLFTPSVAYFHKLAAYMQVTKVTPLLYNELSELTSNGAWNIPWPGDLPLVRYADGVALSQRSWPDNLPSQLENASENWTNLSNLLDFMRLDSEFPLDETSVEYDADTETAFTAFLKSIQGSAANAAMTAVQVATATLCDIQNKWDGSSVRDWIENVLKPQQVSDLANPASLRRLIDSVTLIQKAGVDVATLSSVNSIAPDYKAVLAFRGALQKKLGMESWRTMVASMMNTLRIRQRDALVAFLTMPAPALTNANAGAADLNYLWKALSNVGATLSIASGSQPTAADVGAALSNLVAIRNLKPSVRPSSASWTMDSVLWEALDGRAGYSDSNDLYSRYLIDTEMNTDMQTSRIVQGSASIQLFVQRILMGLETNGTHIDASMKDEWTWVKSFRLWQANRQVFLYPENWTEPELRDDKTPFFKEFENDLGNTNITSDTAITALNNYLVKLRQVSGLDIVGVHCGDPEVDGAKDTLYVVGKTRAAPGDYYLRKCHRKANLNNVWTPWDKIVCDIQGDTVMPFMYNGSLHLFWPTFRPANQSNDSDEQKIGGTFTVYGSSSNLLNIPDSNSVVQVSVAWTSFSNGKWSAKKQTDAFTDYENNFYSLQDPAASVSSYYHFQVSESTADYLQIAVFKTFDPTTQKNAGDKIWLAGIFTIWHDGNTRFDPVSDEDITRLSREASPAGTTLVESFSESDSGGCLTLGSGIPLFNNTVSGYKAIAADGGFLAGRDAPFFFMEDSRSFYIQRADDGSGAPAYRIEQMSNPLVKEFQKRFGSGDVQSLMRRETQALSMADGGYYGYSYYYYNYYFSVLLGYYIAGDWQAWDAGQNAFELRYMPDQDNVATPYPMEVVDFNYGTPNGIYNWELFFHIPFLVAKSLATQQRYEESLKWYNLIFDPKNTFNGYEKTKRWALNLPSGARFWNFLPFFANADADKTITDMLDADDSRANMPDKRALDTLIDDWKHNPFSPYLIARSRIVAYQKSVVMHYLDTLIAWGDKQFRTDTMESDNEAIQIYILAAEILSSKPQAIPMDSLSEPVMSYRQMQADNMGAFSDVAANLENNALKTAEKAIATTQSGTSTATRHMIALGPKMFFFTIPQNDKLMEYWDLLSDRLFKIRNGMNIEGVKRELALFAPPIDPGLLVRAAAAGIDIGSALGDMSSPLPQYRFTFMVQKAHELANAVQGMGGAILSALEKKDAEALARLRADHETALLKLTRDIRQLQIDEANAAIDGLRMNMQNVQLRRNHYNALLNTDSSDTSHPDQSKLEKSQISNLYSSQDKSIAAQEAREGAKALSAIPDACVGVSGFGGSPQVTATIHTFGIAETMAELTAGVFDIAAEKLRNEATVEGLQASYERRRNDWLFQVDSADAEIASIAQQITAAQIRVQVAQKELSNLEKQIEQSREVYDYLANKYTNTELYQWMIGEVANLYVKNYQLAYDVAKRAEKAYRFDLGLDEGASSFIQFGYWDSLHKGLLAGERLAFDLRRMEMSYIEQNKRELEITKPISLAQLDPVALRDLQEKGSCTFTVPEALFDLDFPGQYFRRIRSVRLTIPCVAGPYTSVSAKLTLLSNSLRKSGLAGSSYPRNKDTSGNTDDPRFIDQRIGIQAIATSQPNAATGMFDFNFRDERYLPFEGAGAISKWSLELPDQLRQFDYRSITDVVMHMSYSARSNDALGAAATAYITGNLAVLGNGTALTRVLSLKREFPDAFQTILSSGSGSVTITQDLFPYLFNDKSISITECDILFLNKGGKSTPAPAQSPGQKLSTTNPLSIQVALDSQSDATQIDDIQLTIKYTVETVD